MSRIQQKRSGRKFNSKALNAAACKSAIDLAVVAKHLSLPRWNEDPPVAAKKLEVKG